VPASDATAAKASANPIKMVVSGNFAAFIRLQFAIMLRI
jgi:hypothetical protein